MIIIVPIGISRSLIAEIAEVLLRHAPASAAVKVRWNGAMWASGRLEWLAGWARP